MNIKSGEKVVIVGENGSGKSNVYKSFNGNVSVSEGKIKIDGIDIKDIDKKVYG